MRQSYEQKPRTQRQHRYRYIVPRCGGCGRVLLDYEQTKHCWICAGHIAVYGRKEAVNA